MFGQSRFGKAVFRLPAVAVLVLLLALGLSALQLGGSYDEQEYSAFQSEAQTVLSPWTEDCHAQLVAHEECLPCFGISHNLTFEPGSEFQECIVEVKRAQSYLSEGAWVGVRVDSEGSLVYQGPLAGMFRR